MCQKSLETLFSVLNSSVRNTSLQIIADLIDEEITWHEVCRVSLGTWAMRAFYSVVGEGVRVCVCVGQDSEPLSLCPRT